MESIKLLNKFYKILFNPSESVCWSKHCYGTVVTSIYDWNINYRFFAINPLRDSRKDSNVTCFRNILIEFDTLSEEEQNRLIDTIPFSTVVWSGGKSYHAIISLKQPCKDRQEYDALVLRIQKKLPDADKTTKNPSRFSRAPGAIRDNGNEQTLMVVGSRVSREMLEAWLGPDSQQDCNIATKSVAISKDKRRILMPTTNFFLMQGASPGFWNISLFNATCDMVRAGYEKHEIEDRMRQVTGQLDRTDLRTIQSALDTVHRDAR